MTPGGLHQLRALAEARRAAALARLDALRTEDARLGQMIVELSAMLVREGTEDSDHLPHFGRRLAWYGHRIAIMEQRRRDLALAIAAARAQAGQSVGKHEALGKLVEQADRNAALHRQARADREAPPPGPQAHRPPR